jgi:glycosyltransferase involved in cell wall biosynthesis
MSLGIGVITYNRLFGLFSTITKIKGYTASPYYLVVADDGSPDQTAQWCQDQGITVITGANRGVCWNKNRALAALLQFSDADPIILLEDDCYPEVLGWEKDWIVAAQQFRHVNYAHPNWPKDWCRGGTGTAGNPWLSWEITGQATITTREALYKVGYLDTQFKGYGYGHIEWTERFCKAGYIKRNTVPCIRCGLSMHDGATFRNMVDVNRNYHLGNKLRTEPFKYGLPWTSTQEMEIFQGELRTGLDKLPLQLRGNDGRHHGDCSRIMAGCRSG